MSSLGPPPPDGDRDQAAAIMVPQTIVGAIAFTFFGTRLYVRARIVRKLWWDDVLISLGMLSFLIQLVTSGLETHYGVGRHEYYISLDHLSQALKWETASQFLLAVSTMFTRMSICLFLLLVFGVNAKWRLICLFIIAFIVVTNVPAAIAILAACNPIQKLWYPNISGTCWPRKTQDSIGVYLNGVVLILSDIALAILPVVFLWKVQISVRTKVGICCLLSVGLFSMTCAIVRTILLSKLGAEDITYNIFPLAIWASMETATGLIAACIPTLKPLFKTLAGTFFAHRSPRSRGYKVHADDAHHLNTMKTPHSTFHSNLENKFEAGRRISESSSGQSGLDKRDEGEIRKVTEFSLNTEQEAGGGRDMAREEVIADRV